MKKLLLTGANGFLGSYFIKKYNSKYDIKKFSFLNDSLNKLDINGVTTIVHLSALVHQMSGASQDEYEKVNVTQTLELAKRAKRNGINHFIFMSTVKVYGEETSIAYNENSICTPEDEYGKSKLKAEKELLKLEDNSFKVSIIRTPVVYGYGVKANIKNLIKLVQKVPILPFGKINNRRSMVYIGNLCHMIDMLIENKISGVFLAADDEPLSTSRLIELIAKYLNKNVYLIKVPFFERILRLNKPSFHKRLFESLEVDNTQTKKQLNLQNIYTIEDGIKLMICGGE